MKLTISELNNKIKKIDLHGRMDILGTSETDIKFTEEVCSESTNVIIDLSDVDFMSSIGIGLLVSAAKTIKQRNGKIVFFNPQPIVFKVLDSTRITSIVPVAYNLETAINILTK